MKNSNRKLETIAGRLKGNQINWNQVYYFSEIAAAGSIKEAAERLELTPSTLSLHLSQLEEDLEVQLFFRQHRKLTLTPEGTRLYQQAKTMFEAGQRLIDVVSPIPLGCYPVSVALVPSPSLSIANRVLGKLLQRQEPFNMKVFRADYAELEKGLSDSRFDFGFSDRIPERKDLVHQRVSQAFVKFYVAPKWADTPFSELLQRLPLLICNAVPSQRSLAEQALIDAELVPSAVVTSDYPSTLMDLCQQGAGIGVFSETPMQRMAMQGLTTLRIPQGAPKLQDNLFVLWAQGAENTAAVKLLQEALKEENFLGTA
ncbi:LysR family transcriptional regulator [bacterium]|nr:LysR family transcriptional regulator [bacterium]